MVGVAIHRWERTLDVGHGKGAWCGTFAMHCFAGEKTPDVVIWEVGVLWLVLQYTDGSAPSM